MQNARCLTTVIWSTRQTTRLQLLRSLPQPTRHRRGGKLRNVDVKSIAKTFNLAAIKVVEFICNVRYVV